MVIAVCGLPGSGKSYFASHLASKLNFNVISSDKIRRSFITKRSYTSHEKLFIYDIMLNKMEAALGRKEGVVLDATFYKKEVRAKFIKTADKLKTKIIFINIKADKSITEERLSKKRKYSEADYKVFLKIVKEFESLEIDHLTLHSTQDNIEEMLSEAQNYIQVFND